MMALRKRDPEMVYGEIKLPFHRKIVARLALGAMRLRVPGAARLYFRSLFGAGIELEVQDLDIPELLGK